MRKRVRKKLAGDAAEVHELGQRQGTSESEAVRQAEWARAAEEIMAAIRELHTRGGIDDV